MNITDITDEVQPEKGWGESGVPRSVGSKIVHVTEAIEALDRVGMTDREVERQRDRYSERGFDLQMCGELGFCWEDALEKVYMERRFRYQGAGFSFVRPGEVWKDGMVGSPDALEVGMRVHEIKLRWKSMRNWRLEAEEKVLMQAASYCAMTGVRECWFHVGFVMANWGFGGGIGEHNEIGPVRKVWKVEWGKRELWEHWGLMKRGRDLVLEGRREEGKI